MSPILAYHATNSKCRKSIAEKGLLGASPTCGRPFGCYVFADEFQHPARAQLWWTRSIRGDLWRVAYIGPLAIDPYVVNGMILLDPPIEHVELVP